MFEVRARGEVRRGKRGGNYLKGEKALILRTRTKYRRGCKSEKKKKKEKKRGKKGKHNVLIVGKAKQKRGPNVKKKKKRRPFAPLEHLLRKGGGGEEEHFEGKEKKEKPFIWEDVNSQREKRRKGKKFKGKKAVSTGGLMRGEE